MRTSWVVPIMEDLMNFAAEQNLDVLAGDLAALIDKHKDQLLSDPEVDPDDQTIELLASHRGAHDDSA